jgi:regulator of ribonuclease activity A
MSADETVTPHPTADLADAHIGSLDDVMTQQQQQPNNAKPRAVPRGAFQSYGSVPRFAGRAHVVAVGACNTPIRTALEKPGQKRILVVKVCDPQAARRCAYLGDNLAALCVSNGWAGVVVAGMVRDTEAMRAMPGLGVVALGSSPLKSSRRETEGGDEAARQEAQEEGVDLSAGVAVGAAGWAVVRDGDVLYVDPDGFVISDRVLEL